MARVEADRHALARTGRLTKTGLSCAPTCAVGARPSVEWWKVWTVCAPCTHPTHITHTHHTTPHVRTHTHTHTSHHATGDMCTTLTTLRAVGVRPSAEWLAEWAAAAQERLCLLPAEQLHQVGVKRCF